MVPTSNRLAALAEDNEPDYQTRAVEQSSDELAVARHEFFSSHPVQTSALGGTPLRTTVLAVNAQGKLGTELALETFLTAVNGLHPGWDMLYISELDGFLGDRSPPVIDQMHVQRYYPGPGSRAMGFVSRHPFSCTWKSRFGAATFTKQGTKS